MKNYLIHYGILGQKWGQKNGPPYPLTGGTYSASEKKFKYKKRNDRNSIYNKKHFDKTLETGTSLKTLSYDKDRTKGADMFYAAYTKSDTHQYNALFNKKIPQTIYDEDGKPIGTGNFYKYRITNNVTDKIKVASEDSGADAFLSLYSKNRDFKNFVEDPKRMQSLFVESKYKFKGYREARDALDRIRNTNPPKERDLRIAYRMMNYVIPAEGSDIAKQRARLFSELEKSGYGAMLDTNDAIYGAFKANAPIIVFNQTNIISGGEVRVTDLDKKYSEIVFIGAKTLGMI